MSSEKNKHKKKQTTHDEMVVAWMNDPAFKAEYDALEDEYQLLREMLRARKNAELTQEDVAERMGTHASAVARLEATNSHKKSSPSLNTLRKYARAVGCKLEVHFKPFIKKALKEQHA